MAVTADERSQAIELMRQQLIEGGASADDAALAAEKLIDMAIAGKTEDDSQPD
jgi:hypothetical protein